jgi:hypothetical protein
MPTSNNEDFQAVRITEAGSFERISLDRNKVLDSLYGAIGCRYVEVIQATETISIWVDEEGLMRRPTPNYLATLLAAELGFGQVIVGVVVFTGGADSEGNTLPLGDGDLRLLEDNAERFTGQK